MDRNVECRNCGKDFERSEDSDFGGFEKCPHCGEEHSFSFETNYGLILD